MYEKSSRVMVETCLESISKNEDKINSMITVTAEDALRQADEADKAMQDGRWLGLLHGIPIAVKDNIETAGVRTTSGSVFLTIMCQTRMPLLSIVYLKQAP